jgi:hypothetical protein
VQNAQGLVVAALAKVFPFVADPTIAESIAAWQVVKLCVDRGFHNVVLEGDFLIVVSVLNYSLPCWSSYGQLIEDIKVKLQSPHPPEVNHVSRTVNTVAHTLAKYAIIRLLDDCPSYIQPFVFVEQVSTF